MEIFCRQTLGALNFESSEHIKVIKDGIKTAVIDSSADPESPTFTPVTPDVTPDVTRTWSSVPCLCCSLVLCRRDIRTSSLNGCGCWYCCSSSAGSCERILGMRVSASTSWSVTGGSSSTGTCCTVRFSYTGGFSGSVGTDSFSKLTMSCWVASPNGTVGATSPPPPSRHVIWDQAGRLSLL